MLDGECTFTKRYHPWCRYYRSGGTGVTQRLLHLTKHPSSRKYADVPEQRHFKIIPRWLHKTDISQDPQYVFELDFDEHEAFPLPSMAAWQ